MSYFIYQTLSNTEFTHLKDITYKLWKYKIKSCRVMFQSLLPFSIRQPSFTEDKCHQSVVLSESQTSTHSRGNVPWRGFSLQTHTVAQSHTAPGGTSQNQSHLRNSRLLQTDCPQLRDASRRHCVRPKRQNTVTEYKLVGF